MTILLTGGSGKTATRIAALLAANQKPFLLGSRQGPLAHTESHDSQQICVKFDMGDESTWTEPFRRDAQIEAVYLMEPRISEPWVSMNKFVDFAAKKHGVKRFVLCAGMSAAIGKDENLLEPGSAFTINTHNKIFTATQDGKIPFVSADDIADVAFHALTAEKSYNCDFKVLGPENLTYDLIAEKLSKVLGRKIEHVKLDEDGRIQGLVQAGLSDYFARFLTRLELSASRNSEMATSYAIESVTGHLPKSFEEFVQENRAVWSSD